MEKIVKVLVAADLLLSAAIIAITISFISHVKSDSGRYQPALAENQAYPAAQTKLNESSKAAAETASLKSVDITLSDDKIAPLGFSAYTDDKIEFNITNSGKTPRSFQIESLSFDSGSINPGETKKVTLGTIPNKEEIYEYISVASDDSPAIKGSLIILTRQ
jgi:hypothetical protein